MDEHNHAVDWRQSIRKNTFRTYGVMGTYVLMYLFLGLLIDAYLTSGAYPNAPLSAIFGALISFQLFPLATCITLLIAVISILVTYAMHDRLMLLGTDYHEVTPTNAQNVQEQQLYNVVEEMKVSAGLRFMPKVYIVEADYMNAFASGYSEKSAMVCITRGLMEKLNRQELQAVMAHELSHVRHLDIKLTLFAAVLGNLLLMIIDFLFYSMLFSRNGRGDRGRNQLALIIMILRFLLPLVTMLLMLYLSRTREYMADAGCVELMRDNHPLASALEKISQDHEQNKDVYNHAYRQTPHENVRREAYIFDPVSAGIESTISLSELFSTHPSLKNRLKAIGVN